MLLIDDDGDQCAIQTEDDLTDAIAYFQSGSSGSDGESDTASQLSSTYTAASYDTSVPSSTSNSGGGSGKVALRIEVVVEYDGPSLSDVGSVLSFDEEEESLYDEDGRRSSWSGSSVSASQRTSTSRGYNHVDSNGATVEILDDWDDESVEASSTNDPFLLPPDPPPRQRDVPPSRVSYHSDTSTASTASMPQSNSTSSLASSPSQQLSSLPPPLSQTSSSSTQSELNSRWLQEQASRRNPTSRSSSSSLSTSFRSPSKQCALAGRDDSESFDAQQSEGELELQRDPRGRWFYRYSSSSTLSASSSSPVPRSFSAGASTSSFASAGPFFQSSSSSSTVAVEPAFCSECATHLIAIRYTCLRVRVSSSRSRLLPTCSLQVHKC